MTGRRPPKPVRRDRDGIPPPELRSNGAWRYRVRDEAVGRYLNRTFKRTEEDAERRTPGIAEGDCWARDVQAKVQVGLVSAATTTLADLGAAYLAHKKAAGRSESQCGIIPIPPPGPAGCADPCC
jgi:hypothetical protein